MSLPEDTIMYHLDMLLTGSEPGAMIHHLHVLVCRADAVGPLGSYDPGDAKFDVHALAGGGTPGQFDAAQWTAQAVLAIGAEYAAKGELVLFAGLAQEIVSVDPMDALAKQLYPQGRLGEHPDAFESTIVYGAARDGRRWRGRRYLTGPKAGTSQDVLTLVGLPGPREAFGLPAAVCVRRLVGLTV